MGSDKRHAEKGARRTPERKLLTVSFLMGGVGIALGALFFRHKTRKAKFRIGIPISLLFNAGLLVLIISGTVILSSLPDIACTIKDEGISEESKTELKNFDAQCAMVLGCGVFANGSPTPMLKDRLDAGIALYKEGITPKLLLSGDGGQEYYNEIKSMYSYCIEAGIPPEDIFCDHAGFSTYESVYRAQSIFDAERIIIVTQKYHEYRAIYIAGQKGMDVVGVAANPRLYAGFIYREVREILARNKDVVKTALNRPPTYGGEVIPITGDGTKSH